MIYNYETLCYSDFRHKTIELQTYDFTTENVNITIQFDYSIILFYYSILIILLVYYFKLRFIKLK